jgi:hypothetical protein
MSHRSNGVTQDDAVSGATEERSELASERTPAARIAHGPQ